VTLAPGQTEPDTITLSKQIPAGPWNAQITLTSGIIQRSAEATITFPAAGAAPPVLAFTAPKASHHPKWLYPAVGGGAALLIVNVGIFTVRKRRPL
jgi:hypothetical protein